MAEDKVLRSGICAVSIEGREEDWKGGGRWAAGQYEWELVGFEPAKNENSNEPSLIAWLRCLTAPEGQEGRVGQRFGEYFSLSDKAVNFLISFMATLAPGGFVNDREKCTEIDGQWYPVFDWITGGDNGRGAVFAAAVEDNTYVVPRGKNKGQERTTSRLNRGSVKLQQPSSYYQERRGAYVPEDAQGTAQAGGGNTSGGSAPQGAKKQTPVGWGAPAA